jgi:hypothetical protein
MIFIRYGVSDKLASTIPVFFPSFPRRRESSAHRRASPCPEPGDDDNNEPHYVRNVTGSPLSRGRQRKSREDGEKTMKMERGLLRK